MTRTLITGLILSFSTIAGAEAVDPISGNYMKEVCQNNRSGCYLWATGVFGGMTYGALIAAPSKPSKICLPTGVTIAQETEVFLKYLDNHPERLHAPASVLAIGAWLDAWPCP